jgi:hypothetical protein
MKWHSIDLVGLQMLWTQISRTEHPSQWIVLRESAEVNGMAWKLWIFFLGQEKVDHVALGAGTRFPHSTGIKQGIMLEEGGADAISAQALWRWKHCMIAHCSFPSFHCVFGSPHGLFPVPITRAQRYNRVSVTETQGGQVTLCNERGLNLVARYV